MIIRCICEVAVDYFVIWFVGLVCGFCLYALYEYSLSQKYMDKVNNVEPEPEIDDLTWFSELIKTDEYAYFKLKALPERFMCCGVFFKRKIDPYFDIAFSMNNGKGQCLAVKIESIGYYKISSNMYCLLENNIEYIEWYK